MNQKKRFTVILRAPDYASSNWPDDRYWSRVVAKDKTDAVYLAREEVARLIRFDDGDDLYTITVITGWPEAWDGDGIQTGGSIPEQNQENAERLAKAAVEGLELDDALRELSERLAKDYVQGDPDTFASDWVEFIEDE